MEDRLLETLDELINECMNTKVSMNLFGVAHDPRPGFVSLTHKDMRTHKILISSNEKPKIYEDEKSGLVADVFIGDREGYGRGSAGIEDIQDFEFDPKGFVAHIKEDLDAVLKDAGEDYLIRKGKSLKSAEPILLKLSEEEKVQFIDTAKKRYSHVISDKRNTKLNVLSKYFSKIVRENEPIEYMSAEITAADRVRRFANSEGTYTKTHSFVGRCRLSMKIRTYNAKIIEHIEDIFYTRDPTKIKTFEDYLQNNLPKWKNLHWKRFNKYLQMFWQPK